MNGHFPPYLHRPLPTGQQMFQTSSLLEKYHLHTVCEEAKCPNRLECFSKRTATFLALGKACTRNCGFCSIDFSKTPPPPDVSEPERIAAAVDELGLVHAVITMVTRDDLPDQGAKQIAAIIRQVRAKNPQTSIEVLTSDFNGDTEILDLVLAEKPEIFNHNIETVRSLTPHVRNKAEYDRSLAVLRQAKNSKMVRFVKSGLMLGFGETHEEICDTIRDLAQVSDIITIGQYLQPSPHKLRVKEFISLERFHAYEKFGQSLGVLHMYCSPFVRSDYNAILFAPSPSKS